MCVWKHMHTHVTACTCACWCPRVCTWQVGMCVDPTLHPGALSSQSEPQDPQAEGQGSATSSSCPSVLSAFSQCPPWPYSGHARTPKPSAQSMPAPPLPGALLGDSGRGRTSEKRLRRKEGRPCHREAGHGGCPPRGGRRVSSPALGPMARGVHGRPGRKVLGWQAGVQVRLEWRQEAVRPGQGTEGRSPSRVPQKRCHAGQVTPNLGLQPCLVTFGESTTHKPCLWNKGGEGVGGPGQIPGPFLSQFGAQGTRGLGSGSPVDRSLDSSWWGVSGGPRKSLWQLRRVAWWCPLPWCSPGSTPAPGSPGIAHPLSGPPTPSGTWPGEPPACSPGHAGDQESESWGGVASGSLVHAAGSWATHLPGLPAWGTCGPLDSAQPRRKAGRLLPHERGKMVAQRASGTCPGLLRGQNHSWDPVRPAPAPVPHLSTKDSVCPRGRLLQAQAADAADAGTL